MMTASKSQRLTENKVKTTRNSSSGACPHSLETDPENVSNETDKTKSTVITGSEVVKESREIKKDTAQKFLQAVGYVYILLYFHTVIKNLNTICVLNIYS